MKYKAFPGVIKISVCGKHYLVTMDETIEINETAAFYWDQLINGANENELVELVKKDYEVKDDKTLKDDIKSVTDSFVQNRLLVRYSE